MLELLDVFQDYAAWYSQRLIQQPSTEIPEVDPRRSIGMSRWHSACRTLANRPRQVVTINMCAKGWLKPWIASILKYLCQTDDEKKRWRCMSCCDPR